MEKDRALRSITIGISYYQKKGGKIKATGKNIISLSE